MGEWLVYRRGKEDGARCVSEDTVTSLLRCILCERIVYKQTDQNQFTVVEIWFSSFFDLVCS